MTQTLYNLRHDGNEWRVTKFVDGEVESSYLTTHTECDCPAGHRQTCRHRQMLPDLLPIADTHWFWNFDGHIVVDLLGTPKSTIDALIAPLACAPAEQDTKAAPVPAGLHGRDVEQTVQTDPLRVILPPASWRRL